MKKAPNMAQDLYRDLRDKRLLPVVAVLIVALIAVPLLLGGSDAEPVPVSSATSSSAGSGAVDAPEARAVVVQQPEEIREFNKRLDDFTKKNPFKQQLTGPTKQSQKQLEEAESSSAGGGGGGGETAAPGGGGGDNSGGTTEVENFVYTFEIDVKVGVLGDGKKKKGVKAFSFLPGKKRPVVQYVSSDFDATEAFFVVSRNVNATQGDGVCAPSKKTCSFLLMNEGDEHTFQYEPDGRTYRLKVTKITRIETKVDESVASEAAAAFDDLKKGK